MAKNTKPIFESKKSIDDGQWAGVPAIRGSDKWPRIIKKKKKIINLFESRGITMPKFHMLVTSRNYGCATWYRGEYFVYIPLHALDNGRAEYFDYYAIHEIAHIATYFHYNLIGHNEEFYSIFYSVCPPRYWFWEIDYKPLFAKLLKSAGYIITKEWHYGSWYKTKP